MALARGETGTARALLGPFGGTGDPQVDPGCDDRRTLELRWMIAWRGDAHEEALRVATALAALTPGDPGALVRRAASLAARGQEWEGRLLLSHLEKGAPPAPDDLPVAAEAWLRLGDHRSTGDYLAALAADEPWNAARWEAACDQYALAEEWRRLEGTARQWAETAPGAPEPAIWRAVARFRREGRLDAGTAELVGRGGTSLRPGVIAAAGGALVSAGQVEAGEELLVRAVERHPRERGLVESLVLALHGAGRQERVRELAEEGRLGVQALLLARDSLRRSEMSDACVTVCDAARRVRPEDPVAALHLAAALEMARRVPEALEVLDAMEPDPLQPWAAHLALYRAFVAGRSEEAAARMDELEETGAADATTIAAYAQWEASQGRATEARARLARATARHPDSVALWSLRLRLEGEEGCLPQGEDVAAELLATQPSDDLLAATAAATPPVRAEACGATPLIAVLPLLQPAAAAAAAPNHAALYRRHPGNLEWAVWHAADAERRGDLSRADAVWSAALAEHTAPFVLACALVDRTLAAPVGLLPERLASLWTLGDRAGTAAFSEALDMAIPCLIGVASTRRLLPAAGLESDRSIALAALLDQLEATGRAALAGLLDHMEATGRTALAPVAVVFARASLAALAGDPGLLLALPLEERRTLAQVLGRRLPGTTVRERSPDSSPSL